MTRTFQNLLSYRPGPVLLALALILMGGFGCHRQPEASCVYGGEVPEEELKNILQISYQIINLMEEQKYGDLYELTSKWARNNQNKDQFTAILKRTDDSYGIKEYSQMKEVYLLNSKSKEESAVIPCNLGQKGIDDLWTVPANEKLAIAIFESKAGTQMCREVLQLLMEDGKWKLVSISVNPLTIKSHKSDYYALLARKSRENNKLHLAMMQYVTAILLQDLGPNCQEWFISLLGREMNQIQADYIPVREIQVWSMPSGKSYNVYDLNVAGAGDQLYIDLAYVTESLDDEKTINAEARELAEFLDAKFPEYREGFDGIRVTAITAKEEDSYKSYHVPIPFKDLPEPPKTGNPPESKNE